MATVHALAPTDNLPSPAVFASMADRETSHMCDVELFFDRIQQESMRHRRYLGGFGLVRITPILGRHGQGALREAIATELRRCDAACGYSDGSFVLLLVNADRRAVTAVVRRLNKVAQEIISEKGGHVPTYAAGGACADGRRVNPEELWTAAEEACRIARDQRAHLVMARWD